MNLSAKSRLNLATNIDAANLSHGIGYYYEQRNFSLTFNPVQYGIVLFATTTSCEDELKLWPQWVIVIYVEFGAFRRFLHHIFTVRFDATAAIRRSAEFAESKQRCVRAENPAPL